MPVLGILLLDTAFPRIPGDVGNPLSYPFPVRIHVVPGATVERVVFQADPSLQEDFIAAAQELASQGVAAITSSCGYLSPIQEAVARAVDVPVFLSSLAQVPLAYDLTHRRVGIITANAQRLTSTVLTCAGIEADLPMAIAGLEDAPAFSDPILKDGANLDREQVQREVLTSAEGLLRDHPEIGSFVFECHNLAPYARAVQQMTGKPVFDIIDYATWLYAALCKRDFPQG